MNDTSLIRRVGPEEAELRAQWADATALAWYAETPAFRVEAQAIADRLWLELVASRLKAEESSRPSVVADEEHHATPR